MKKSFNTKENIRDKIIGLGKDSIHKSYYPQLQQYIKELVEQKKAIEKKNTELVRTLVKLRETQNNLKKSEQRFRILFENATDAIFIHNSKFEIIDSNKTAEEIFGYKREELLNQTPDMFSPNKQPSGDDSKKLASEKMNLALEGKLQVFEWAIYDINNTIINTLISLNSFKLGEETYIQAIVRDISQIKKLENELLTATVQTEENERARFAKELHDGVGPILSTIKLYFQWLAETNDETQRKVIIDKGNNNIEEAIRALKEVSNNLSPHILTNYGLGEGLQQFIERITSTGSINIDCNCDLAEARFSKEIEITLYRVLIELINNTIKHAQASKIDINITKDNNTLNVSYKDNGKGFDLSKIGPKSGLGIYNIRNRIQTLGGTIELNSEPASGFNVNIILTLNL
jgi:PAS domain S-box-containing protein